MPGSTTKEIAPAKSPNKILKFLNSKSVVPYFLVAPFILSFLVFSFYPSIKAIIMSFQSVLPGQVTFIGLNNYSRIFNPTFYKALSNTTIYVILTVAILVTIPIILSVLLDSNFYKSKTIFRATLYIPALTSSTVAGMVFRLMFGETHTAAANQILHWIGLDSVDWRIMPGPECF